MNEKKLYELLNNKEFVEKMVKLKTPEEVQIAFNEKGVEISLEDIQTLGDLINLIVQKGINQITDDDLKDISGGEEGSLGFSDGLHEAGPFGGIYLLKRRLSNTKKLDAYSCGLLITGLICATANGIELVNFGHKIYRRKKANALKQK